MIKFILILIISLYLINKVGKFFYKMFFPENDSHANFKNSSQKDRDGKVHVQGSKKENKKKFKAGEYVDFEELD